MSVLIIRVIVSFDSSIIFLPTPWRISKWEEFNHDLSYLLPRIKYMMPPISHPILNPLKLRNTFWWMINERLHASCRSINDELHKMTRWQFADKKFFIIKHNFSIYSSEISHLMFESHLEDSFAIDAMWVQCWQEKMGICLVGGEEQLINLC